MESYDEIESRMVEKYRELTGCDCSDASDISIKIKLLAGELFNLQSSIEWINNQLFPQTASGTQLEYHASMRGLSRKQPTAAAGELTFSVAEPAASDIAIPAGTLCSTVGKNPAVFATTENAQIYKSRLSVTVPAVAVSAGSSGNAAPGCITVITKQLNSLLSVENAEAFTGGSDLEDDESLRRRILDDIKTPSTGVNKAYYRRLAESVDGVHSANVVPRVRGNGTIDIYIAGRGSTLDSSYTQKVQELISSERELNVDVLVQSAELISTNVSLYLAVKSGYDFSDVRRDITTNIREFFASLRVGEGVYTSKLGAAVAKAPGIDSFLFSGSSMLNITAKPSQLYTLGTINIYGG